MRRAFRYALGWLVAATALVWVSFAVIGDAVYPGRDTFSGRAEAAGPGLGGGVPAPASASSGATPTSEATVVTPTSAPTSPGPATSPQRDSVRATATPSSRSVTRAGTTARASTLTSPARPSTASRPASGPSRLEVVPTTGGRVTLRVFAERIELVSATPNPGYGMQTWEQAGWLRVLFTNGPRSSSVIATWHEGWTRIQVVQG
ncbi:MAG: hypothetical protein JNL54_15360 [Kineosporiaceae bacterium]|nr:hypothetical protein [Kineosporiaceae bacterium]